MSSGPVTHQATASLNRRAVHDGREHLVAPVIAIRESVLNGELAPASEIGRHVAAWNGIPLVIGHPRGPGGEPVTANQPAVLDSVCVGRLYNAHFDGTALHGELWVDIEHARQRGWDALAILHRLESGQPLEVSTAYFRDIEPVSGTYNGRRYDGVQRNLRPDHLALLPNEVGACSWADGCGAPRINRKGSAVVKGNPAVMWFNARRKDAALAVQRLARTQMGANEDLSYEAKRDLLETAMRQATGDPMSFWIQDVYDEVFVYQTGQYYNPQSGSYYRRTYSIDENQLVTLGEPEQVVREVTYRPVDEEPAANAGSSGPAGNQGEQRPPAAPVAPQAPVVNQPATGGTAANEQEGAVMQELIDGLIANVANSLAESDREWLEKLSPAQLQALAAPTKPAANACTKPADPAPSSPTPAAAPQSLDEWIQSIPDAEIREQMAANKRELDAKRTKLLADLKANAVCAYTEDELKAMPTGHLQKLARSMQVADYSGQPGPRVHQNQNAPPPPPPVVRAPRAADQGVK